MKDVPVTKNNTKSPSNVALNKENFSKHFESLVRQGGALSLTPLALLLAACGGGGSGSSTGNQSGSGTGSGSGSNSGSGTDTGSNITTSGRVIDGYISGIEVFRDVNDNYQRDSNETFVVTNSSGFYSGLTGPSGSIIVARDLDGGAVDVSTGLNFSGLFIAPSAYETVNPVSTIVSLLASENNKTVEEAEALVKSSLGISESTNLSNFDPFSVLLDAASAGTSAYDSANEYQVAALQVANILLASGGDPEDFSLDDFLQSAKLIANKINSLSGEVIDLSDASVISQLIVSDEISIASQVASANSSDQYSEVLNNQIQMVQALGSNNDTGPSLTISMSEELLIGETATIYFKFSEAVLDFQISDISASNGQLSQLTLLQTNVDGSVTYSAKITPFTYGPMTINVSNDYFDLQGNIGTSASYVLNVGVPEGITIGGPAASDPTSQGRVADGYISGARVFRDEDGDGEYDAGEPTATTSADGSFTLSGSDEDGDGIPDAAIVADNANGTAIDTSTGLAFNAVLAAPAGSTIVNPITTMVNELVKADTSGGDLATKIASATTSIKDAFGLTNGNLGEDLDLMSYDPIAALEENGTDAVAQATQGVAAWVANIVVSGSNDLGGDSAQLAANSKTVLASVANYVKSKADAGGAVISLSSSTDVAEAVADAGISSGSNFVSSIADQYTGWDITDSNTYKDLDELVSAQIATQSELSDGLLTEAEASDGAQLIVEFSEAISETVTVTITGQGSLELEVEFTGAKTASLSLSSTQLALLGSGQFTATATSAGGLSYTKSVYYHSDVTPEIAFDAATTGDLLNGLSTSDVDGTLDVSGTVTITLPEGVTLPDSDDSGSADTLNDLVDGRTLTLLIVDDEDTIYHTHDVTVRASDEASTGVYSWATSINEAELPETADLADGSYKLLASFSDLYGAKSDATYSNSFVIDRKAPALDGTINNTANGETINIADGSVDFSISIDEPASIVDAGGDGNPDEITLSIGGSAVDFSTYADTSVSADSKTFTFSVTPDTGAAGDIVLAIASGAFEDAGGNTTTTPDTDTVAFDFETPTVEVSLTSTDGSVGATLDENEAGLSAQFVFSEAIEDGSFVLSEDVAITGGTFGTLATSDNTTFTAPITLSENYDGAFSIAISDDSYADAAGNTGSGDELDTSYTVDTVQVTPFSVGLVTESAEFNLGETIQLSVVFTGVVNVLADVRVGFTIGSSSVVQYADRIPDDSPNSGDGTNTLIFEYTVTNSDVGTGISIQDTLDLQGGTLVGDNGVDVALDISSLIPEIFGSTVIDGGQAGSGVDGYLDGSIVYADNDDSGTLTEGDAIAQTDATGGFSIYGATGNLTLEGGVDISTGNTFDVQYQAPFYRDESGGIDGQLDANDTVFSVINPITTILVQNFTSSFEGSVKSAIFTGSRGDNVEFATYNPYASIADIQDTDDATSLKEKIAIGLEYQKAAASVALVVDVISSAAGEATTIGDYTTQKISSDVFALIAANHDFDNAPLSSFGASISSTSVYDGGDIAASVATDIAAIKSALNDLLDAATGNLDTALSDITADQLSAILDVVSEGVLAINLATTDYTIADAESDADAQLQLISEEGINALSEVVQIQQVAQVDLVDRFEDFISGNDAGADITTGYILGDDQATSVYESAPIGTVVPIRYSIENSATNIATFEGNADGSANVISFTVTRSGSIKTTSSVDYEVQGDVSADDFSDGLIPSGTLFFDVNEREKTITLELNNDEVREQVETLFITISDPEGLSQFENDTAYARIRDDDPSTPEIENPRSSYDVSEGNSIKLDAVSVDYFDLTKTFDLSWSAFGGTVTVGSQAADDSGLIEDLSYFELQAEILPNVEFNATDFADTNGETSGGIIFTLTADADGRNASNEFEVGFDIHRLPTLDISSTDTISATAGVAVSLPEISVSDWDSDYLDVTFSPTASGSLSLGSSADVTLIENVDGSFTLSGEVAEVAEALSDVSFTADATDGSDNTEIVISVDDSDSTHTSSSSTVTATLDVAEATPTLDQSFRPSIKINEWVGLSGIEFADTDSTQLKLTISETNSSAGEVEFRFEGGEAVTELNSGLKSMSELAQWLDSVEVKVLSEVTGAITLTVADGDGISANSSEIELDYIPMQNAVPTEGGDISADPIDEDSDWTVVTISGITLEDSDGSVAPNQIKVLSYSGAEVEASSGSLFDDFGLPNAISVSSTGQVALRVKPDENSNNDVVIQYVVVDPDQPQFTSAISEITIGINALSDAPNININALPTLYFEGSNATSIFQNVTVSDIDADVITAIEITVPDLSADESLTFAQNFMGMIGSETAGVISYIGELAPQNVAALLKNIKIYSSSDSMRGETKVVTLKITDSGSSETGHSNETTVTKIIEFIDFNDAPTIADADPDGDKTFTEGGSDFGLGSIITVIDPEGDNISSLEIKINKGYKVGKDALTFSESSYADIAFSSAEGKLSIIDATGVGLTQSQLSGILENVAYTNTDDALADGEKTFVVSATDTEGFLSVSDPIELSVVGVNDAPQLLGSADASVQFVSGLGEVKIAPNLKIADVDNTTFSKISVNIEGTALANSSIGLSEAGTSIAQAFLEVDNTDPTSLIISGESIDTRLMETLLSELVYNHSTSIDETGLAEELTITIEDASGSSTSLSNTYAVSVSLLQSPPIIIVNTADSLTEGGTPVDTPTLTGTETFDADRLFIDLSKNSVRVDGERVGSFKVTGGATVKNLKVGAERVADIDLSLLQSNSSATIIGSNASNKITGSSGQEFIDGGDGSDEIVAGAGNDVVAYDGTDTVVSGGEGNDTLILPKTSELEFDLSQDDQGGTSANISGFENIDGRMAEGDLVITGSDASNTILGGSGGDQLDGGSGADILVGAGGNDSLRGGAGNDELIGGAGEDTLAGGTGADTLFGGRDKDTFVIELNDASNVDIIEDFTRIDADVITFSEDGVALTEDLSWSGLLDSDPVNNTAYDAWVIENTNGTFTLKVVNANLETISVALGQVDFGTPSKWWDASNGNQLTAVKNEAPIFVQQGPKTSPTKLLKLGEDGVALDGTNEGEPKFVISQGDGDTLSLDISITSGAATITFSGQEHTVTADTPLTTQSGLSVSDLNAAVATLAISASERGAGSLTISITDGYIDTPITKEVFFEAPNNTPTIGVVDADGEAVTSIDGYFGEGDFGQPISITSNGTLFLDLQDIDALDQLSNAVKVVVELSAGTIIANDLPSGVTAQSLGARKVALQIDSASIPSDDVNRIDLLSEAINSLTFLGNKVGEIDLKVTLQDGAVPASTVTREISGAFKVLPTEISAPILVGDRNELVSEDVTELVLNGSQAKAAEIFVDLSNSGIALGDTVTIVVTHTVGQETPTLFEVSNTVSKPSDLNYLSVPLEKLLADAIAADDTLSFDDGIFTFETKLVISGDTYTQSDSEVALEFRVDTTAPGIAELEALTNDTGVSSSDFVVSEISSDELLTFAGDADITGYLVKFSPEDDSLSVYQAAQIFDPNSLLIGGTTIKDALATSTYDAENQVHTISPPSNLDQGVYFIITQDTAGNITVPELTSSNFTIGSAAMPAGVFIIDTEVDRAPEVTFGFFGDKYRVDGSFDAALGTYDYKIGSDNAGSAPIFVKGLDEDAAEITISIDDGVMAEAISETFTATFGDSPAWGPNGSVGLVSETGSFTAPIFEFDISNLQTGFFNVSVVVTDVAGNTTEEIISRTGQFEIDVSADVDGNLGMSIDEAIATGTSLSESAAIEVAFEGVDLDAASREFFAVHQDVFLANLYSTSDGATDQKIASELLGDFSDWSLSGENITVSDVKYAIFENNGVQAYLNVDDVTSGVKVSSAIRPTGGFVQSILDMDPVDISDFAEGEVLFLAKIEDAIGNVAFSSSLTSSDLVSAQVILDFTAPTIEADSTIVVDDTGASDRVTSDTSGVITIVSSEALSSIALVRLGDATTEGAPSTPSAAATASYVFDNIEGWDVVVTETPPADGETTYTYAIDLNAAVDETGGSAPISLEDGAWLVDTTDMAGNSRDLSAAGESVTFDNAAYSAFSAGTELGAGVFVVDTTADQMVMDPSDPNADPVGALKVIVGDGVNIGGPSVDTTDLTLSGLDSDIAEIVVSIKDSTDTEVFTETYTYADGAFTAAVGTAAIDVTSGVFSTSVDLQSLASENHNVVVRVTDVAGNVAEAFSGFGVDNDADTDPAFEMFVDPDVVGGVSSDEAQLTVELSGVDDDVFGDTGTQGVSVYALTTETLLLGLRDAATSGELVYADSAALSAAGADLADWVLDARSDFETGLAVYAHVSDVDGDGNPVLAYLDLSVAEATGVASATSAPTGPYLEYVAAAASGGDDQTADDQMAGDQTAGEGEMGSPADTGGDGPVAGDMIKLVAGDALDLTGAKLVAVASDGSGSIDLGLTLDANGEISATEVFEALTAEGLNEDDGDIVLVAADGVTELAELFMDHSDGSASIDLSGFATDDEVVVVARIEDALGNVGYSSELMSDVAIDGPLVIDFEISTLEEMGASFNSDDLSFDLGDTLSNLGLSFASPDEDLTTVKVKVTADGTDLDSVTFALDSETMPLSVSLNVGDDGLQVETSYAIVIEALDAAGNSSSQTLDLTVTDPNGPQPLRVEEVSRDGDTVTYGIFVNADQLANMYDGTDNDGTADVPGVQDIFTKLGYTETDFTSAGLTNFSVTTAGRNASDLEYVNAFWTGGATEGVTGSPQILQAYWDQSAAEGVWEAPWTGDDGEEYGISIDADVDFRDPWMTFEGTLATDVETVTFTLFETELDDTLVADSTSTI